jgi:hypothetical protein
MANLQETTENVSVQIRTLWTSATYLVQRGRPSVVFSRLDKRTHQMKGYSVLSWSALSLCCNSLVLSFVSFWPFYYFLCIYVVLFFFLGQKVVVRLWGECWSGNWQFSEQGDVSMHLLALFYALFVPCMHLVMHECYIIGLAYTWLAWEYGLSNTDTGWLLNLKYLHPTHCAAISILGKFAWQPKSRKP